jgi:hypothetical protein
MLAASEFPARYSVEQVRATVSFLIEAACDVQRPSSEMQPAALAEGPPGSEDDWIRYYLKLADKVLVQ